MIAYIIIAAVFAVAGFVAAYLVLKNNKTFLNTSLAEIAAKALAKANAPSATKKP